jgi:hypothetical protein
MLVENRWRDVSTSPRSGNVRWVFLLPMFDLSEVISEPI